MRWTEQFNEILERTPLECGHARGASRVYTDSYSDNSYTGLPTIVDNLDLTNQRIYGACALGDAFTPATPLVHEQILYDFMTANARRRPGPNNSTGPDDPTQQCNEATRACALTRTKFIR